MNEYGGFPNKIPKLGISWPRGVKSGTNFDLPRHPWKALAAFLFVEAGCRESGWLDEAH